ncbi:hypothetical protein Tco_0827299 [Tanacetum coccineum]
MLVCVYVYREWDKGAQGDQNDLPMGLEQGLVMHHFVGSLFRLGKGVVRFGKRGKLNPRYVGSFKVLETVRAVAYKLELPQELSKVHNTFHEPVVIIDHDIKQLKQSRIPIVKFADSSSNVPADYVSAGHVLVPADRDRIC